MASYWSDFIKPGPHPAPQTSKGVHPGASKGGLTLFPHGSTSALDCMDAPPLDWSRQLRYPSLSTIPFRLCRVTSHSMIPHLQRWPLHPVRQERSSNPDLHALSRTCLPSLTGPRLAPKLPLPSLQAAALAAMASPTTFLRLKPYVFLKNLWALRAFVKLLPCPPRKPMALHTSVQR
jgi:hypothetical protein